MKICLVAIDSQYIHTNLAVRSIAAWCNTYTHHSPRILEATINQQPGHILEKLAGADADIYQFSLYIWNIELAKRLAADLRKLKPNAIILAGGPEVAYTATRFLQKAPAFDAVLCGEGETVSPALYDAFDAGQPLHTLPGVTTRHGTGPAATLPDLARLPFPYTDLASLGGRILYYESMRGCPFRCSYCLSSVEPGVRFKPLPLAFDDLSRFLRHIPRQVKFIDRTFNADPAHALAIWRFLQANDNGVTNFHFELKAELLTEEQLTFLATVRPGLFQFEVGVQSTNLSALSAIQRPTSLTSLHENVGRLHANGNIHLHLDLIAGLPHEDKASFTASFNKVYSLGPHQMQLGFLKVLPGSGMEATAQGHGLSWSSAAPYQILYNRWLAYEDITYLEKVAAMVELYHNSGRFTHMVAHLAAAAATPYAFFEGLAALYETHGYFEAPPGKLAGYELLGEYAAAKGLLDETLEWLCRYDLCLHEKPRKTPAWVRQDGSLPHRGRVLAFYAAQQDLAGLLPNHKGLEPKQLLKSAHIEVFPFCPNTGEQRETPILFDYTRRSITGQAFSQIIGPI